MSYCRWSSDNWRSAVYAYEHVDGGVSVHVAARKHVLPGGAEFTRIDMSTPETFATTYSKQAAELGHATLVPLGLSRDGESFDGLSFREAAELLRSLQAEGYHVPPGVIDTLLDEAKDM
jgi:hypothetical protein